jgi:uncharacterized SAM-binding protein YcdF (DUF218 family)
MLTAAARGIALFLGGFTLLNVAGDLRFSGTDGNLWWIDLWPLPLALSRLILIAFAIAMIAYAIAPRLTRVRLYTNVALITIVLVAAIGNTIRYYVILARGDVHTTLPLPLSLLIAIAMIAILIAHHRWPQPNRRAFIASFIVAGVIFPIAQIALFGLTDYRRRADLIVVFGAHAFANGVPSRALADRIDTGVELYRAGLAPRLLFSGGPGDGAVHETEAMRRYAVRRGVPDSAIAVDRDGINTESTARNTIAFTHGLPTRVLAVSHFYHLPRIKMTYQRYGLDVFTVPSKNDGVHPLLANLVREDAAFWRYYLRRITTSPQSAAR